MNFMVDIDLKKLDKPIAYGNKILLTGSCFTEHIGNTLQQLKFDVLQNPNGILFDPQSVCSSLISYVECKTYSEKDFFQLNGVWHSWQHHSRFSNTQLEKAVEAVNVSQQKAHNFLKQADWLIITLGSAFSYQLMGTPENSGTILRTLSQSKGVANCHRAPAKWFSKHLLTIEEIITALDETIQRLFFFNNKVRIIFTVSPVRHIRDGVINNNRSKARLIEAVHHMVNKFDRLYYFPAYELLIDVLRDYRFYDVDLVHPNFIATQFVLQKFEECCIDEKAAGLMKEVEKILIARKHKPLYPDSQAHQEFLKNHFEKAKTLQQQYPFLNFEEELNYFSKQIL
ncbi:MAG: GSCFA domain-containing protein [Chitinophagaceae bacterium]